MHNANEQPGAKSYKVLVNNEEQYSLWPADDDTPGGWRDVGQTGSKDICAAFVESVWVDMRPKSLRERMDVVRKSRQADAGDTAADKKNDDSSNTTADHRDLVSILSSGDHPVVADAGSGRDAGSLKSSIEKGFVYITFTRTSGEAELGVALDSNATSTDNADFEAGTGNIHLVGDLTINGQIVRCIADIDIATLEGLGHLESV